MDFSSLLALEADLFTSTVYIPRQLTSAHIHLHGWNSEVIAFCPPIPSARSFAPNRNSSLAPICSKSVSRWHRKARGSHSLLRGHEASLLGWSGRTRCVCMPIANMCSLFIVLASYPPTQPATTQADGPSTLRFHTALKPQEFRPGSLDEKDAEIQKEIENFLASLSLSFLTCMMAR